MENIMMEGHLVLKDFDGQDTKTDPKTHLYCITYVDSETEHDLMLIWRSGEIIRSRSVSGGPNGYGRSFDDILIFAKMITKAHELLGLED